MSAIEPDSPNTEHFRIGAVESMSGVPAVTIRMWERRYQAVVPERTPKNGRLYSRRQIARLRMLKQLVDAGHSISTVAPLSDEELQVRIGGLHSPSPLTGPVRLGLLGHSLKRQWLRTETPKSDVELVLTAATLADIPESLQASLDVLMVEIDVVTAQTGQELKTLLRKIPAQTTYLIYYFGASDDLAQLRSRGIKTARAPLDPGQLRQLILSQSQTKPAGSQEDIAALLKQPIPARRFSDSVLQTLNNLPPTLRCECPQHLSHLITQLSAFEDYSSHCESRSPRDAAMHAALHAASAHSRRLIEDALTYLIDMEYDGRLPDGDANDGM